MLRQLLTHKLLEPHSSFQLQRDINTDSVAIFGHRRHSRENNSSAALAVGGCHSALGLLRPDSAQIAAWMSARRAPCCAPTELRACCAARPPWQPSLPALARVRPRPPRRRSIPCRPPGQRLTPPRAGPRARPALQLARSSGYRRQLRARHVAHPACCSPAVLCAPTMLRTRCGCARAVLPAEAGD